jgi:RNA 3'-terminal phosphate cyclase (ATP)
MLEQAAGGPLAEMQVGGWGWYPSGGGALRAHIRGGADLFSLQVLERGPLRRVSVLSAASNLPRHIVERQALRAEACIRKQGIVPRVKVAEPPSTGKGTVVFILAQYEHVRAGFTAYGRIGKPAEQVAEEACRAFVRYHKRDQPMDQYLGDQLLVPMALAKGSTEYAVSAVTQHLLTNAWLIGQFLEAEVSVCGKEREPGIVRIQTSS